MWLTPFRRRTRSLPPRDRARTHSRRAGHAAPALESLEGRSTPTFLVVDYLPESRQVRLTFSPPLNRCMNT